MKQEEPDLDNPMCPKCGSSMSWVDCGQCDEFGMDGHDCGEDYCCCLYPEDNMICDTCGGDTGWWICLVCSRD